MDFQGFVECSNHPLQKRKCCMKATWGWSIWKTGIEEGTSTFSRTLHFYPNFFKPLTAGDRRTDRHSKGALGLEVSKIKSVTVFGIRWKLDISTIDHYSTLYCDSECHGHALYHYLNNLSLWNAECIIIFHIIGNLYSKWIHKKRDSGSPFQIFKIWRPSFLARLFLITYWSAGDKKSDRRTVQKRKEKGSADQINEIKI